MTGYVRIVSQTIPAIPGPVKCEVRAPLLYLAIAKNETPANIQCECFSVYDDMISRDKVTKRCMRFEHGRTNIHDEQWSGNPSIVTDEFADSG